MTPRSKTCYQMLVHIFTKYQSIFHFFQK